MRDDDSIRSLCKMIHPSNIEQAALSFYKLGYDDGILKPRNRRDYFRAYYAKHKEQIKRRQSKRQ